MDEDQAKLTPDSGARSRGLWQRLRRAIRREDGSSTIEFVILFPIYMVIFSSAFEMGLHMTKQVMLDRALDVTVRALRLGQFQEVEPENMQDLLRLNICQNAGVIKNCQENLFIEMIPIETGTWDLLASDATCIEREADGDLIPVTDYEFRDGQANDLMLIRVCAQVQPMFPTTGLGLQLNDDGNYYHMIATSAFVIEPRS